MRACFLVAVGAAGTSAFLISPHRCLPHRSCAVATIVLEVTSEDKPIHINALPAYRSQEAQDSLAHTLAAAQEEERNLTKAVAAAIDSAAKLRRSEGNLRRSLEQARHKLYQTEWQETRLLESQALISSEALLARGGPIARLRSRRRQRREANEKAAALEALAAAAQARTEEQRLAMQRVEDHLREVSRKGLEAAADVEQLSTLALQATAAREDAQKEVHAQAQVRNQTAEDMLRVVASATILAESVSLGVMDALTAFTGPGQKQGRTSSGRDTGSTNSS